MKRDSVLQDRRNRDDHSNLKLAGKAMFCPTPTIGLQENQEVSLMFQATSEHSHVPLENKMNNDQSNVVRKMLEDKQSAMRQLDLGKDQRIIELEQSIETIERERTQVRAKSNSPFLGSGYPIGCGCLGFVAYSFTIANILRFGLKVDADNIGSFLLLQIGLLFLFVGVIPVVGLVVINVLWGKWQATSQSSALTRKINEQQQKLFILQKEAESKKSNARAKLTEEISQLKIAASLYEGLMQTYSGTASRVSQAGSATLIHLLDDYLKAIESLPIYLGDKEWGKFSDRASRIKEGLEELYQLAENYQEPTEDETSKQTVEAEDDPFRVLGVTPQMTTEQIKKVYMQLQKIYGSLGIQVGVPIFSGFASS